jgi:hypothetical protein
LDRSWARHGTFVGQTPAEDAAKEADMAVGRLWNDFAKTLQYFALDSKTVDGVRALVQPDAASLATALSTLVGMLRLVPVN